MNKSETIDIGLFYVMPKIGIGYEYLINDFHPVLNNRFGVSIESSTLIPTKNEFKETAIPCFPQMELKFGVHYYFNKMKIIRNGRCSHRCLQQGKNSTK